MIRLAALLILMATFGSAQEAVTAGSGAVLRGLDKLDARVVDINMRNGERVPLGLVEIDLIECRYPVGNPTGNAYAYLTIRESGLSEPVFSGWMVASSPALNAMDHPRYDVWVLRCTTS